MSGIDGMLILGLLFWSWRIFPRRHPVRLGAALSLCFLISEALIGAALVKLEHVARNASVGRGWSLSGHLLNTLALLACLTLTAWWARGGRRLRLRSRTAWIAVPGIALVLMTAISGAIAALGDTLFPATSFAAGFQQDFDPAASVFLRLRLFHPPLAIMTGASIAFYVIYLTARMPGARPYARAVAMLLGLQLGAGVLNLVLLAPIWMQIAHLLIADLLWIALVLLIAFSLQDSAGAADSSVDEMAAAADRRERAGAR